MREPTTVILHPQLSEKSQNLQRVDTYVFIVDLHSTKGDIRNAVEKIYKVKVGSIRTVRVKGKTKKNKNMLTYGRRKDWKKAFVKLKEGQRLDII